jgi:sialic acid synthase SpsE
MQIKISENKFLGDNKAPYVLAEVGINHNGDFSLAVKLIEEAAKAGVDGVKFQRRTIDEMYKADYLKSSYVKEGSFGDTYGSHKKYLEFNDSQLLELKIIAENLGLDFIVSGFDFSGFEFVEKYLNPPYHKIASPLVTHHPLLKKVASYGKPMVISTGMHSFEEVEEMMQMLLPITNKIILLQCTTSYPTEDEDVNLRVLNKFKKSFGVLVGYSSHDRGVILPAASVALGSCFIEKHFTLDRTMKGPDHIASVEPRGMELIVKYAKSINVGLGKDEKYLTDAEQPAKQKHGYSIVARHNILKGTFLEESMFAYKQPGTGLKPSMTGKLIGKQLNRDLMEDDDILLSDLL